MPVTIIMPKINDIRAGKKIILKFDMPAIFIAIISSDWTKFKNNMIDYIKKINGRSLYILECTFKKVKDKGNNNPTPWSLKKFTSSNKLRTIPKAKKARETFNMVLVYSTKKYFLNILNLNILLF